MQGACHSCICPRDQAGYYIDLQDDVVVVSDTVDGRDGTIRLVGIKVVRFAGGDASLAYV
jgi:hypothetical protein